MRRLLKDSHVFMLTQDQEKCPGGGQACKEECRIMEPCPQRTLVLCPVVGPGHLCLVTAGPEGRGLVCVVLERRKGTQFTAAQAVSLANSALFKGDSASCKTCFYINGSYFAQPCVWGASPCAK